MPPFWSLGWHAASGEYLTQADVEAVVHSYDLSDIPLEGIWIDLAYMAENMDFKVNTTSFPTLKNMTLDLQAAGQRVVVMVDSGLRSADPQNSYYSQAV